MLIKKIFLINSSTMDNLEKAEDELIYLVTIQTLFNIFLENVRLFTLIKETIDISEERLFSEGSQFVPETFQVSFLVLS